MALPQRTKLSDGTKPSPRDLRVVAIGGGTGLSTLLKGLKRYVLTPTVFDTLSSITPGAGGELQLTDGLRGLLKREKMYAYVYEGRRYDAGDKLGFLKANVELALKNPDLGDGFRAYLKTLKL